MTWLKSWHPEGGAGQSDNGNDTLTLSGDHTTTLVYQGDGSDTLTLSGQNARIQFADQTPDQISVTRNGNNLVLANESGDTVTVSGWLQDDGQTAALQTIQFADGVVWNGDGIRNALLAATPNDDHLIGYGSNDVIDGGAGNDALWQLRNTRKTRRWRNGDKRTHTSSNDESWRIAA